MIVLAYTDNPLAANTGYNADFEVILGLENEGAQQSFKELKLYELPTTGVVTGKTLRGKSFEHITFVDTEYTVTISADELLSSTKRAFLKAFWGATHKYLVTDLTTGDYIPVVSGGGLLPVEFINENKYLQEVTLKLVANNG